MLSRLEVAFVAAGRGDGMIITETRRLLLRELDDGDTAALEPVLADPEVMRFSSGVLRPTEIAAWIVDRREEYARWGFGCWAVVAREERRVVGYCGLTLFDDLGEHPEVEVGYRLARASWGRGLATEAAAAVRDHAFGSLGLSRLIALVDPSNRASVRVAEKLGMRHERDVMRPGYTHPDRLYAVLRA